ncbi:putative transcriptional regulator [Aquisphaera giovannonii]|uniref:Putative transcriptional regulator n=1 Tax=Aquisphaera giovannonii TaxID=406548 RepID=A0A5B9W9V8_9BACT|nr:TetR/AcrR family transcriptional regulator [Aquisphaera giovannonii]QEH36630.1 putative transcriptional regulator [Aquisphaera giovannonii]
MDGTKSAKARVLEVAEELFYREGVRAVGIDTIIARSGVAKMSLYRNFPSKDALIVAYLEERNRQFFERWDGAVGPEGAEPRARLSGLVARIVTRVREPGFRGCPFLNARAEFPDATHPARAVIEAHRSEVRRRLAGLCRDLNARDPESLAAQLLILINGIYASGIADDAEARAAVEAADALIEAHVGPARPTAARARRR